MKQFIRFRSRTKKSLAVVATLVIEMGSLFLPAMSGVAQASPSITEYSVPTASATPEGITFGPDGASWFVEYSGNNIGRIDADGSVVEYAIPTSGANPYSITTGPDNALWFTEFSSGKIGRITTSGTITEFSIPSSTPRPYGIATGPDGALWFTETNAGKIGRITTSGNITEFSITGSLTLVPTGIASGSDGALWFANYSDNSIGRITTNGVVTIYHIPSTAQGGATTGPYEITNGPDGALWFSELSNANHIGRITTSGVITEFPIPTSSAYPLGITVGSDGALWFTELAGNKIGHITTSGDVTEISVPTDGAEPAEITAGANGSLWFTEDTGKIGYISTAPVASSAPTGLSAVTPTNNAPVLTWNSVPTAASYQVWRQDTLTGLTVEAASNVATNNFTDVYSPGVYNYTVVAVNGAGAMSAPSTAFQVAVTNTAATNSRNLMAQGQSQVLPAFGRDILPGLASGNAIQASFDFDLGYPGGVFTVTRPLTFTFNAGGHTLFIAATSSDWLVINGANNAQGTFQGVARVDLDNVTTAGLPYTVTAVDGMQAGGGVSSSFKLTVFADSSRSTVLYSVNGPLTKGKIKVN